MIGHKKKAPPVAGRQTGVDFMRPNSDGQISCLIPCLKRRRSPFGAHIALASGDSEIGGRQIFSGDKSAT
ncbi:MAG: hypothetical protein EBS82_05840 [Methylocystaceae bacterium]|nr:hypothetical protein [Methylocystaceae bacterium]